MPLQILKVGNSTRRSTCNVGMNWFSLETYVLLCHRYFKKIFQGAKGSKRPHEFIDFPLGFFDDYI